MYFFHKLVRKELVFDDLEMRLNNYSYFLRSEAWCSCWSQITNFYHPFHCLKCLPPWTKSFLCLFWQGQFCLRHQYTLTYKRQRTLLLQSGHMEGCWPGQQTDRSLSNGLVTWLRFLPTYLLLTLPVHSFHSLQDHLYHPCTQETSTCLNDY